MKVTGLTFLNFITVAGRNVNSLIENEGYEAEILDFPWVAVWPKNRPTEKRITTIFNVRDRNATEEELTAPDKSADAKPVPQSNRKG